jgi:cellulose synthase/poly-beta-1,6-N-acetylglucosamine synthase-like glycosyltransferase
MTDADTLMDSNFVALIAKEFENDTQELIAAIGGYVVSLKHNWMTACREIDYIIGQNIFKKAQSIIDYVYVMPGCATAIRTPILKELIFNHDTVTEDLDFTFQLHLM